MQMDCLRFQVGDLIDFVRAEDKGIDFVAVYNDGWLNRKVI